MTLQELLTALDRYWTAQGCVIPPPYDLEMGAGIMHPITFFRALGPDPWRTAYVQPTRRPADSRYARNPNRVQRYYQYQVLLKPPPPDVQRIYLDSLLSLGIDLKEHDVRFIHDDWELPALGTSGFGWQVWLDGMEISQLTYLQQLGGCVLHPVSVQIAYGPERLAMCLQKVESLWELEWAQGIRYGDLHLNAEEPWCRYNFEEATVERLAVWLADYEAEALAAMERGLVLPAYDYIVKCCHAFDLLDSRGALSTAERIATLQRVSALARRCAEAILSEHE